MKKKDLQVYEFIVDLRKIRRYGEVNTPGGGSNGRIMENR